MADGDTLVVRSAALPAITPEQMVMALDKYRELQTALDRSMPDQIMNLDGKPFRKKGYWRAIALAFNLEVTKIEEKREVTGKFNDGRDNFGYIVTYQAKHPSGRSMTGDGACFAVEKARRFKCPHPESEGSKRTLHFPHNTCPSFDPDFQWRALPGEATEHNVRSHANTRAYNRAVSNLVGFGEVSAEEVERDEHAPGAGEKEAAPVGSGQTAAAAAASQQSGQASKPSGLPEGATKVKKVTPKSGTNARGPWTRWDILFEDGRRAGTFSKTDGEHAERAEKSGAYVIPNIKKTDKGHDLTGFEKWPSQAAAAKPEEKAHPEEPIDGPEKILTVRKINTEAGVRFNIQTDKRELVTDNERFADMAVAARNQKIGLTPKIEIVERTQDGKKFNKLLALTPEKPVEGFEDAAPPPETAAASGKTEKADAAAAKKGDKKKPREAKKPREREPGEEG